MSTITYLPPHFPAKDLSGSRKLTSHKLNLQKLLTLLYQKIIVEYIVKCIYIYATPPQDLPFCDL